MTEIVLVRHAATSWSGRRYCGRSDPSLSTAGRAGARALADALAPTLARDVLIVTSPARRARQTAAAIAAAAGVDGIEVDERWQEADFGIAEGRTFDELAALDPAIAAALAGGATDIDWPGGETAADLAARVAAAWADLGARARSAGRRVARGRDPTGGRARTVDIGGERGPARAGDRRSARDAREPSGRMTVLRSLT